MTAGLNEILEGAKPTIERLRNLPSPKIALEWSDYIDIDSSEKTLGEFYPSVMPLKLSPTL